MAKYNRANFGETTLGAAIANDSATAITVTSGTSFPAVPFLVTIGTEILKCTSKGTGENWTVTRGEQSSVAAAHDNGTKVENNITADDLNIMAEAYVAVTQASHPFAAGDIIYCSGANTYAKAKADAAATSDVVGVVSVDVGTDDFIYCASGKMTTGVPAVAAGSVLFLSDATAGLLTTTEPTAAGHISLPVAIVTENAVSMIVYSWRGMEIGTAGSGDVIGPASAIDGNLAVFNGVTGKIIKDGGAVTAAGLALLDDANAAAQIATLGLDADIATLSLPASTTITAAGAAILDDAAASDQRTTLGLGTMATAAATDYIAKAVGTAHGDLLYFSASATPAVVAHGTDDQVLHTHSDGSAPAWGATPLADEQVTYAKMQHVSATDKLLGRSTAGAGDVEEIACTAAGRALLDDANAAAQIATLGLDADIATLVLPASTTITSAAKTFLAGETAAELLNNLSGVSVNGSVMTGNLTLGENTAVALDPAGSADEKWSGITVSGTAGATIAVGDLCYLNSGWEWVLTDANAAASAGSVALGICILAANNDGATNMLLMGTMRSAAFPASITGGAQLYVSTTAGDMTTTQPTGVDDVIRVVGWAILTEPNTIYFNPSPDFITRTA